MLFGFLIGRIMRDVLTNENMGFKYKLTAEMRAFVWILGEYSEMLDCFE